MTIADRVARLSATQVERLQRAVAAIPRWPGPGRQLVGYVVVSGEAAPSERDLRAFLKPLLPDPMIPSRFVFLERLPLTATGKIDRRALPRPAAPESPVGSRQPRGDVETRLAAIWAEVLSTSRVDPDENFFELGGHSLLAAQVVARARETFAIELPLQAIFEFPTVAALAERIERVGTECRSEAAAPAEAPPDRAPSSVSIPRRPPGQPPPVSFAQERIWFLEQLNPGSAAYTIAEAVRLRGALDLTALERSLNEVVKRHDVLRTNVREESGRPVQVVHDRTSVRLRVVDLSGTPEGRRDDYARRVIADDARTPFDLAHGSLARFTILRLGEESSVALVTIHHIVCDGWSLGVLMQELSAFYNAFVSGALSAGRSSRHRLPPGTADLPVQYGDYAAWQRERMQGAAGGELLDFWREQVRDLPDQEWPADRPRPRSQTFSGALERRLIAGPAVAALKALSRHEGATLFMTLAAGFAALLARHLDTDDVAMLTRMAGRPVRDVEGLIGLFLNSLVLRTDLSGNPTFRELIGRVRESCVRAYAHQDLPFDLLTKALAPARDPGRHPFSQVMCALQNYPQPPLSLHGVEVSPFESDQVAAWLDLDLSIVDAPGGLDASLTYNVDLFERATAGRILDQFEAVLTAAAANPNQRVADLSLWPSAAPRSSALKGPDAEPFGSATLPELFEMQVDRTPDALALVSGADRLTFHAVDLAASRLAQTLRFQGVRPEVPVAVSVESPLRRAIALLAVLKAGGVYVPVDPAHPAAYRAVVLEVAGVRVVVDDGTWPAQSESGTAERRVSCGLRPANAAYAICTSGSSGAPKAVVVSHAAMVNRLLSAWQTFPPIPGEVACQRSGCSFSAALYEILTPLLQGVPVVLVPPSASQDPAALAGTLERHGVTRITLVPSLLAVLLGTEIDWPRRLPRLTSWTVLGERLCEPLCRRFRERLPHAVLWNDYGATEVTAVAFHETGAAAPRAAVPIGKPVFNTTVHLLDARLRPVPPGVTGEICIASPGAARGYLNRPDLTADRFVPDAFAGEAGARLYRSGDAGRRLADGGIECLGRRDQQVKIRGARVELEAIETALMAHHAVREAAVHCTEVNGATRLTAYVVPAGTMSPTTDDLFRHLEANVPPHAIPSRFVQVDGLPQTPTGKMDRRALSRLGGSELAPGAQYTAPRTEPERALAAIYEEVLGVPRVDVHTSFFRLGGDSILSVRVAARARQAGYAIAPLQIFQFPAIADLAAAAVPLDATDEPTSPQPGGASPFPYARLTPEELDRFLSSLRG